MFHSVRPKEGNLLPHSHFFALELFVSFLDSNIERLRSFTPSAFRTTGSSTFDQNSDGILLTFDDGLFEHYRYVFKELQKRELFGIFFVPTRPLHDNVLLTVHKVHLLSGYLGYPSLINDYFMKNSNWESLLESLALDSRYLMAYPYDTPHVARFKYAINYLLSNEELDAELDAIILKIPELSAMMEHYYLSMDNVREMSNAGMLFGYHGHTHQAFSRLNQVELQRELDLADQVLADTLETPLTFVSYPFGDRNSVDRDNIALLERRGVKFGFMAETANAECSIDLMMLPRIDCRELINF